MGRARQVPVGDLTWQVTCAAARPAGAVDRPRLGDLCHSGPAWDRVEELARWHRVEPLLHRNLAELPAGLVPGAVLDGFARAFARTAARNLRSAAAFQMILGRLEDAGAEPVSFKGPTLAVLAYGSLALRVFEDVDVIVAPEAIGVTLDVLAEAGFRPGVRLTHDRLRATFAAGRALPFVDPRGHLSLDLHASLMPLYLPFRAGRRSLDADLRRVPLLGGVVATPAPELLMVTLCVHGTKHFWERLYWVCDIAALAGVDGLIDWERLRALADDWRLSRMVRVGLQVASDLLGAPMPVEVTTWVESDHVAVTLATEIGEWLACHSGSDVPGLRAAWMHIRAIEGIRSRGRFCRHILAPGAGDWEALALPASLGFLYYPARIVRLMTQGIARDKRAPDPPP